MNIRAHVQRLALPIAALAAAALLAMPAHAVAAPAVPKILSPAQSAVVASTFVLRGRVGPQVTAVRVTGASSAVVTLLPADATGATFTASVTVHYGKTRISITASDGVAWSAPATLDVWQLGTIPKNSRFVLVDKSDFMLYAVISRRVVAAYPVAIGMYGTPTPTGTRYLARPSHAPNGVWGPFRMRLCRKAWVRVHYYVRVHGRRVRRSRKVLKLVGTSYYIHGTNAPDSIGTRASHGCVRLWNSNLRIFKTLTTKYELTIIRA